MKIVSVSEITSDFGQCLKASKKGPVVVTDKGKPVAVLIRTGNREDLERLLMGHSAKLQAILEEARKRFRAGEGIPHEVFWKQVKEEHSSAEKETRTRKNGKAR